MLKVGDKVVYWSTTDYIREGTITNIMREGSEVYYVVYNSPHHSAYVLPIKYKDELKAILEERAKLKKAYEDSEKLIYELRNKYLREM